MRHLIPERLLWLLAVVVIVLFGRWRMTGLSPDAALYAGLSHKVLVTGEGWLLAGTENRFPKFFEHPPYFFQWGAHVLATLGTGDGVARAIGALPASVGFFSILLWTWLRMGWATAAVAAIMAATFGHYTKFAATSMMEGPLSTALALVAIGAYELHWRPKTGFWRPLLWVPLYVGLVLATASKGLVGLGAWGGLCLSLALALLFSEREPFKVLFSCFFLYVALAATLAPLGYWFYHMWSDGGLEWVIGYFRDQVFRSATTNRGESDHPLSGDKLYYVKLILKDGWPWWWTVAGAAASVPAARFLSTRTPWLRRFRDPVFKAWTLNALAFFAAFFIPFSLVKFQLPHYLHPAYLVLLPAGASFLVKILPSRATDFIADGIIWRWAAVVIAGIVLFYSTAGVTSTPNRGQPFISAAERLNKLPAECSVLVPQDGMDEYRMEGFALWYWKGRAWAYTPKTLSSKISVPRDHVYWDPSSGSLLGQGRCAP